MEKNTVSIAVGVTCHLCGTTEKTRINIGPHIGIGANEFGRFKKLAAKEHKKNETKCLVDLKNPPDAFKVEVLKSEYHLLYDALFEYSNRGHRQCPVL